LVYLPMPTPSGPPAPTAPPPLPAAPLIADVESFLQAAIADLAPVLDPPTAGPGAPRILPSFCLWAGLLVCVLRGFSRQRDLWRLLTARGLWAGLNPWDQTRPKGWWRTRSPRYTGPEPEGALP
jgi:hypothetical protein